MKILVFIKKRKKKDKLEGPVFIKRKIEGVILNRKLKKKKKKKTKSIQNIGSFQRGTQLFSVSPLDSAFSRNVGSLGRMLCSFGNSQNISHLPTRTKKIKRPWLGHSWPPQERHQSLQPSLLTPASDLAAASMTLPLPPPPRGGSSRPSRKSRGPSASSTTTTLFE